MDEDNGRVPRGNVRHDEEADEGEDSVLQLLEGHCEKLVKRSAREKEKPPHFVLLHHSANQVYARVQDLLRRKGGCKIDLFLQDPALVSATLRKRIRDSIYYLRNEGVNTERYDRNSVLRVFFLPAHVSVRAWATDSLLYVGWYINSAAMYLPETKSSATPMGHNTDSLVFRKEDGRVFDRMLRFVRSVPERLMTDGRQDERIELRPALLVRGPACIDDPDQLGKHAIVYGKRGGAVPRAHGQEPCEKCLKVVAHLGKPPSGSKATREVIAEQLDSYAKQYQVCFDFLTKRGLIENLGKRRGLRLSAAGKALLRGS